MHKIHFSITAALLSLICFPLSVEASYWLVIGSYRQGPGSRPEVSGITSPSLYSIPMKSIKLCEAAGKKISKEIYKPVWQLDNRWTCIKNYN